MNRRTLLLAIPVLPVALTGCNLITTTTTNGITTVTIKVGAVNQYAQAFAAGVVTVLGIPGIAPLFGAYLAPFTAIENAVVQDIAAFNAASSGAAVLTFDANSVPASVTSLLNDGRTILTITGNALPQTALTGRLLDVLNAVQTIVMVFEALLPAGLVGAAMPPLSEAQALAVLGVS